MDDLDEKEEALLASFGYGIVSADGTSSSGNDHPELPPSLNDDASGVTLLYEGGDINDISDSFFEYVDNIDQIRQDIESGDITFGSEAQKQEYLDYLSAVSSENETLYRQQLEDYVDTVKLQEFPSERFKSLINELSIDQLRVFADHIGEIGLKKLARSGKFENLMKDVLSDKNSALQIVADDAHSPICPYIWEGVGIATEENISISGYYYQNGQYFLDVSCDEDNSYNIALGSTKPSDVSIRITRATAWDMAGEQLGLLVKFYASLPVAADLTYATATSMGMMPFLPENISPSDIPYLGEFLAEVDPMNLTAHITKETVFVSIFIEHGGNGEEGYRTDYDAVRFHEYRG